MKTLRFLNVRCILKRKLWLDLNKLNELGRRQLSILPLRSLPRIFGSEIVKPPEYESHYKLRTYPDNYINVRMNLHRSYSDSKGSGGDSLTSSIYLSKKYIWCYVAMLSGGLTVFYGCRINKSLYKTIPQNCHMLDETKSQYIIIGDPEKQFGFIKEHLSRWWPSDALSAPVARSLIEQVESNVPEIRGKAIQKLTDISSRLESECSHFSACMSVKTAITLARNGSDPRLFLPRFMIPRPKEEDYYLTTFSNIFSKLSKADIHHSLNNLIQTALKFYDPTEKEQEAGVIVTNFRGFESSDFHHASDAHIVINEVDFLKICLQGLVSHSRLYERIRGMISLNVLELLVNVERDYRDNVEIMSLVLKILANLSRDRVASAQLIKDTGCLKVIAENAQATDMKLVLPAKRALHNLDEDKLAPTLPAGIYQLHPEYGCQKCDFDIDVIFVHGLLGGVFRTWRRQDIDPYSETYKTELEKAKAAHEKRVAIWKSRLIDLRSKSPLKYNPKVFENPDTELHYPVRRLGKDGNYIEKYEEVPLEVEEIPSTYTQCWPRDWLPIDCPRARIIAVDFESFVTRWMNICPVESVKRHLQDKSAELLEKLRDAGVGERPVIFVCHSMGGLIVKSLLCQSQNSNDPELHRLIENTKGVVFCSVPHYGTEMAVLNTARRWLFLPTEEIEDLSNSEEKLTRIHDCFLDICKTFKVKVLSFSEMLETRTGLGMKFKLVPYKSSDIGFGEFFPLRLDHLSTCKPWSRGSFMYKKVVEFINEFMPPTSESLKLISTETNSETSKRD